MRKLHFRKENFDFCQIYQYIFKIYQNLSEFIKIYVKNGYAEETETRKCGTEGLYR